MRSVRAQRSVGLLLAGLLVLAAAPTVAARTTPFHLDIGRRADYVAQKNLVQCVGASMQMMLNIMSARNDRTAATQLRLQKLARQWSGPSRNGRIRAGASVRGWAKGLTMVGGGPYQVVGMKSIHSAVLLAAKAMRTTGRPVGLLVWRGRHAWVMSGFEATGDPLLAKKWRVTKAYVLDPLYPHGDDIWGPSPRPGTAISVAAVGRQFVRRQTNRNSPFAQLPGQARLRNKWVLVVPTGLIRPGIQ